MRDRGIMRWVKEHIRPYMRFNSKDVSGSIDDEKDKEDKGGIDIKRDIEEMKGRAEVGIKIRWRF